MFATKSVIDYRLGFCKKPCEHNVNGVCRKCGCIIQAKVRFTSSQCPIGLWKQEDGKENRG
jgi:hypothetical protein